MDLVRVMVAYKPAFHKLFRFKQPIWLKTDTLAR
jgi:hypothetical protein